jgi:hypothetical protein
MRESRIDLSSGGPFRANSIRFPQSLGMLLECFAKVLNHVFQLIGITNTERLRDKDFNSVGQAAVRSGHTHLLSDIEHIAAGAARRKKVVLFQKPELNWCHRQARGQTIFAYLSAFRGNDPA